ncbi:ABC-type transporter Mla maintaining outer membrane lipid asymmetry ATPase subunit MlaF [Paraburkholderia sp. GAS42]
MRQFDGAPSWEDERNVSESILMTPRGIVKSYGPTSVLRGFDLSVAVGEVHAFPGVWMSTQN